LNVRVVSCDERRQLALLGESLHKMECVSCMNIRCSGSGRCHGAVGLRRQGAQGRDAAVPAQWYVPAHTVRLVCAATSGAFSKP
jgi:hypothetical protein